MFLYPVEKRDRCRRKEWLVSYYWILRSFVRRRRGKLDIFCALAKNTCSVGRSVGKAINKVSLTSKRPSVRRWLAKKRKFAG